jgi:hypothetical protein
MNSIPVPSKVNAMAVKGMTHDELGLEAQLELGDMSRSSKRFERMLATAHDRQSNRHVRSV